RSQVPTHPSSVGALPSVSRMGYASRRASTVVASRAGREVEATLSDRRVRATSRSMSGPAVLALQDGLEGQVLGLVPVAAGGVPLVALGVLLALGLRGALALGLQVVGLGGLLG